jgi:cell division protease FtsH
MAANYHSLSLHPGKVRADSDLDDPFLEVLNNIGCLPISPDEERTMSEKQDWSFFKKNPRTQEDEPAKEEKQTDRPSSPFGGMGRLLLWLLLAILFIPWLWSIFAGTVPRTEISYSLFREQVTADNVVSVTMAGEVIEGEFREPIEQEGFDGEPVAVENFVTYVPAVGDEQLLPLLAAHDVEVNTRMAGGFPWSMLLITFLPFLLLIGFAVMMMRRVRGQSDGLFSVGKSRARLFNEEAAKTTFTDVAGAEGAKQELQEIITFLKDPSQFERLGATAPKGVLLVGPPGTGKTLLARAVAGEAGVPFFSISGSDFMEMFVGVGASRVRNMFQEAKAKEPAIIFIDELDSIGRKRGAGMGGGHDEREQTLNQLLTEMDGFEPNESVIVIAATNRPDILDPALLRPGRFDRRITVDLPTQESRLDILRIHARNKPMADDVNLVEIARGTPGFSGADLENLLNEAALLAARQQKDVIEQRDIDEARDKVIMGLEREGISLTPEEVKLLAYHEAGHAVVAAALPHADPIHKVTIVPRGRAMGVTQQLPERDKYLYERDYMLDRLAVMLGGRAAEEMILNTATSGAENDLKQATQLARKMVLEWGMSDQIGYMALGDARDQVFLGEELTQRRDYSEETAREADEEIRRILHEAYHRARDVLETYRQGLDQLVDALIEEEVVSGQRVLALLGLDRVETIEPE